LSPPLIIPAAALVIRSQGTQLMVVDSAGGAATVHLRAVVVGRDYGSSMEILSGIAEGATIVTNPGASMLDGMHVRVVVATGKDP
jgi:membrane fusion protein (multidrug efflux system)